MSGPLRRVMKRVRTDPERQVYRLRLSCGHTLNDVPWSKANRAQKRCSDCGLVDLVRSSVAVLRLQFASRSDRDEDFESFAASQLVGGGFVKRAEDGLAIAREALAEVAAGA